MSSLIIEGGKPLQGTITISGCKNSVLPIMAASLLAQQPVTLKNVPSLLDVHTMISLLRSLNLNCHFQDHETVQIIPVDGKINDTVPYGIMQKMRASILLLGPLLSRYRHALISMPGGCSLGQRPIDIHLQGLKAMGANINLHHGNLQATAPNGLHGCDLTLPVATVTGTENLLIAATLAKGKTILRNTAREPEIIDLSNFLNQLGAKIYGAGSPCITIEGVEALQGGHYTIMPDRIEAATWLCAAMATRGHITLNAVVPEHLNALCQKLLKSGAIIHTTPNSLSLSMMNRRPLAVSVTTAPYPGFATDIQPAITAMNVTAKGESYIVETLFENRFQYIPELIRMGANLSLHGQVVHCHGIKQLTAAPVMATDLRAAASLMIAALSTQGETIINAIEHLDRGYANIEQKLLTLGAKVTRTEPVFNLEYDYG